MFALIPAKDPTIYKDEMHIFDMTQNPCRHRETWDDTKWEENPITAIGLYDYIPSILCQETVIKAFDKS